MNETAHIELSRKEILLAQTAMKLAGVLPRPEIEAGACTLRPKLEKNKSGGTLEINYTEAKVLFVMLNFMAEFPAKGRRGRRAGYLRDRVGELLNPEDVALLKQVLSPEEMEREAE